MLKQSGNAIVWSYDRETLRAEPGSGPSHSDTYRYAAAPGVEEE